MAKSGKYSRSVLGASDEVKDIYCEPCQKDGKIAIAEGYCVDCPEYLCAQCYRSHRRNKVLANHVLLDKDSMPITPSSNRRGLDICNQKCTIHSDQVIQFFCDTCDKLGCTICITLDHRQCGKVKHIPDIVQDEQNSQEFTAFHEWINSTSDKLSKFEQNIQANATSNNEMQKLAKQELKNQRAEVNKFFDQLEKKMDDQILTIEKRNKDALKEASDRLEPMKKDLDQIKNDIGAKRPGQNCELFISMKKGKEKMRTFDDQLNKMQGELTIQHYTLHPSEQIQAMMRTTTEICRISTARTTTEISKTPTARTTTEISKTPTARTTRESSKTPTARTTIEISKTPTDITTTEISKTPTARTTTEISKTPTAKTTTEISKTPTARLESVIDIKTSKDKTEPDICSLIIMHGHYCVVVDGPNKSIKVVDTKLKKVTSQIGIEAQDILAVTPVSDNQVVVSVSLSDDKNQIQFFSVSTSGVIQSTNQVNKTDDYYMAMVQCKGNIYGIGSFHKKIDIFNMTGKIIRRIRTDYKGAALFGCLLGIALSPDGQTIYVTDSVKYSVTRLTLDGKVKVIYTDKDLKRPLGITVDKYGYVYVCSCGTKNIHQLTADLSKVQVLIDDVIGYYITYSSTENKLYICTNNNINEYSLDFK